MRRLERDNGASRARSVEPVRRPGGEPPASRSRCRTRTIEEPPAAPYPLPDRALAEAGLDGSGWCRAARIDAGAVGCAGAVPATATAGKASASTLIASARHPAVLGFFGGGNRRVRLAGPVIFVDVSAPEQDRRPEHRSDWVMRGNCPRVTRRAFGLAARLGDQPCWSARVFECRREQCRSPGRALGGRRTSRMVASARTSAAKQARRGVCGRRHHHRLQPRHRESVARGQRRRPSRERLRRDGCIAGGIVTDDCVAAAVVADAGNASGGVPSDSVVRPSTRPVPDPRKRPRPTRLPSLSDRKTEAVNDSHAS